MTTEEKYEAYKKAELVRWIKKGHWVTAAPLNRDKARPYYRVPDCIYKPNTPQQTNLFD